MRTIRRIVKGHYRAAGVTGDEKTTYSLHHSATSNVIRNRATIIQALRHVDPATVMIYAHEIGHLESPAELLVDYGGA